MSTIFRGESLEELRRGFNTPWQPVSQKPRNDVSPGAAVRATFAQELHALQMKLSESLELQGYY